MPWVTVTNYLQFFKNFTDGDRQSCFHENASNFWDLAMRQTCNYWYVLLLMNTTWYFFPAILLIYWFFYRYNYLHEQFPWPDHKWNSRTFHWCFQFPDFPRLSLTFQVSGNPGSVYDPPNIKTLRWAWWKTVTARKSWDRLQRPSVQVVLLIDSALLHSLRLAPLDVQSLSVDNQLVERLLGRGFGRRPSRVLDKRTLLARHDRQVTDLAKLVEVIPTRSNDSIPPRST